MISRIDEKRIEHIFRAAKGHLPDTIANRALLENVANDSRCYVGADSHGNRRFAKALTDGREVWVVVREGVIVNGGANDFSRQKEKK